MDTFGGTLIQSLKNGKIRKNDLDSMRRQEKLGDLLPYLAHDQKRFIHIRSLNLPEMRPLGTFWSVLWQRRPLQKF